jgi:hypothetical protein
LKRIVRSTFLPMRIWIRRIPALDVKRRSGSVYRVPVFTHFALGALLMMCGLVHCGVYFVPQRAGSTCLPVRVPACVLAATATPEAPAINAQNTTNV